MSERVLSRRELNRATLARQLLLERHALPAEEAIERVAGLQAQVAKPPFVGLATRLDGFAFADLDALLADARVVRATLMRATLHLLTERDYAMFRPALQPALLRAMNGFVGKRIRDLDFERVNAATRALLRERPHTWAELREHFAELEPDRDPNAVAWIPRGHLPLVQVGLGPAYALRDDVATEGAPHALVERYLAAFGPATVKDVQTWAGLTGLKPVLEELRPRLRTFRDEAGDELFDVPGGPLPDADVPAPVRLLPDYDNTLLAHHDRGRVIADEHRKAVFTGAGVVRATFLVDGVVAGRWKIGKGKDHPIEVEPFVRLSKADRSALDGEVERLREALAGARV